MEDRQIKNAAWQELQKQRITVTGKIKNLTLAKEKTQRSREIRQNAISILEESATRPEGLAEEPEKRLAQLRGVEKRSQKQDEKRQEKIEAQFKQIEVIEERMERTDKEISRLDQLIAQGAERLRGEKKYFMDVLKIVARNAFYEALAPFKESYNNYRDDHEMFRGLTQSSAMIEASADVVVCHLLPSPSYPKAILRIIQETLEKFNAENHKYPDQSDRRIVLKLTQIEGIKFASQRVRNCKLLRSEI